MINTKKLELGFTLIEVMVVIGLVLLMASMLVFIDVGAYARTNARSEQALVVSILQKARMQALSNINQKPHGVYIEPTRYTIFQGTDYASRDVPSQIVISAASQLTHTGFSQVVFTQLTGESTLTGGSSFSLSDGAHTYAITINSEGQIDW